MRRTARSYIIIRHHTSSYVIIQRHAVSLDASDGTLRAARFDARSALSVGGDAVVGGDAIVGGSLVVSGTVMGSGAYVDASDARLKRAVRAIAPADALGAISQLTPIR